MKINSSKVHIKKLQTLLNKDIKELNKLVLSFVCIAFLVCAGIVSYTITNSYALFSDSVDGNNIIELKVAAKKNIDISGANPPVLSENMLPVYYDEEAEVWKKASESNKDEEYKWYDYNNKIWANSVTVTETSRDSYKNANPGTVISMDDILTMQVWIPRYKYRIFNYNEGGQSFVNPQPIDIMFEKIVSSTGEITCTDSISEINGAPSEICKLKSNNTVCTDSLCNGKTYTHPAFTFGGDELKGIWVGKFEITGVMDNITVKPDLSSLRNQNVSSFAEGILDMKNSGNRYGFVAADDIHMMKNIEWGAVSYLAHSKYGSCEDNICKEVNINNSSGNYTGRSGGAPGGSTPINAIYANQTSTTDYNTYGFYTYDGYLLNYDTNTKSSTKDLSKVASTTGNIYGIYDMSGGANEYVMGNVVSSDVSVMMSGYDLTYNSGYVGFLYDNGNYISYAGANYPDSKYFDKYSFGTSNSNKVKSKLGDAVKEVSASGSENWYSDYGYSISSASPWVLRSGSYNFGLNAGMFRSGSSYGNASTSFSTRITLFSLDY